MNCEVDVVVIFEFCDIIVVFVKDLYCWYFFFGDGINVFVIVVIVVIVDVVYFYFYLLECFVFFESVGECGIFRCVFVGVWGEGRWCQNIFLRDNVFGKWIYFLFIGFDCYRVCYIDVLWYVDSYVGGKYCQYQVCYLSCCLFFMYWEFYRQFGYLL